MRKTISTLLLLLLCLQAFGQTTNQTEQKYKQINILFNLNSYTIDSTYQNNRNSLNDLSKILKKLQNDTLVTISEIKINSYSSPDGSKSYNNTLSKKRSNSIYEYLTKEISVPDSLITKTYSGINWDGLYAIIEKSTMQYKQEVLDIIKNIPEETWARVKPTDRWLTLVDSRNKHLMDLKYGNPYRYMFKNYYPLLRQGTATTIYFKTSSPSVVKTVIKDIEPEEKERVDTAKTQEIKPITPPSEPEIKDKKPIKFALKTNLLYDAMLSPSFEVEVPIGKRWSVAGEWICPWWITKNNGNALQVLSGQVEGRYWFGDREQKPQLTGWFAGLYAGGGLYDLQWKNNGYQGEFYIASGIAGGYAHTINKKGNLRMEYSLGLGYLSTKYRYYEGRQNNEYLVWQHDGKYTWIGPTKAKVSLVWFIDWKRGGKR